MALSVEVLLRYINLDPDHPVIDNKMHRGMVFLKAVPNCRDTEMVSGVRNLHQGSVGVCFVGLREALATFALWLG